MVSRMAVENKQKFLSGVGLDKEHVPVKVCWTSSTKMAKPNIPVYFGTLRLLNYYIFCFLVINASIVNVLACTV